MARRGSARLIAWSVHLLTASGAAWGVLALVAVGQGRFRAALGWMLLATLVDGVDGLLARRFRVAHVLPGIDGVLLDNLVDYLNYVVVPAYLLHEATLLPQNVRVLAATLIAVVSLFQFSRTDAKTGEHLFRGFPCYWNLLAFYLLLLDPDPGLSFAVVLLLCVLVFVPVGYVYPTRTLHLRATTLVFTALWTACVIVLLLLYPRHPTWLAWGSLLYGVYYVALSLHLTLRGRGAREIGP